jgi:hypothetical protein
MNTITIRSSNGDFEVQKDTGIVMPGSWAYDDYERVFPDAHGLYHGETDILCCWCLCREGDLIPPDESHFEETVVNQKHTMTAKYNGVTFFSTPPTPNAGDAYMRARDAAARRELHRAMRDVDRQAMNNPPTIDDLINEDEGIGF